MKQKWPSLLDKKQVNSAEEAVSHLCTDNQTSIQAQDYFDIAIINFQSIISKQANFSLFLNDNHPDIILVQKNGYPQKSNPVKLSQTFITLYIMIEVMAMEEYS